MLFQRLACVFSVATPLVRWETGRDARIAEGPRSPHPKRRPKTRAYPVHVCEQPLEKETLCDTAQG